MNSLEKVLCIGDVILDCYSAGSVERISPEAPIPVLKLSKENREVLGGSGNVARNICAAETKCHLISVIGDDSDSKKIISLCKKVKSLSFDLIVDKGRCATKKHRFVSENQQILRVDNEDVTLINEKIEKKILEKFTKNLKKSNVVVISDYQKGLLTKNLYQRLLSSPIKKEKLLLLIQKILTLDIIKTLQ